MAEQPLHLARRANLARSVAVRLGTPFPGAVLAAAVGAAVVASLGSAVAEPPAVAVGTAVFVGGAALMLVGMHRGYPHAEFGPANVVTVFRLALAAVLVAAACAPATPGAWALPAVAVVALALDGLDGWLARCTGLVSDFGARFDMEVDCLLALALALLVLEGGTVGPWVLGLGVARYAFWGASLLVPRLAAPLPQRRSRKAVCVAQLAVLIALLTPLVPSPLAPPLAAATLAGVAWSFAVDIRYLCRGRA